MLTLNDWLEGARLRTLPAAGAPVIAGTGIALSEGGAHLGRAALALAVALFLQIGVNFSNDYSDGVRGTDVGRVGPLRLTASGKIPPRQVLALALWCFGIAGLLGLVLVAACGKWWLLIPGAAAIVAAWYYTGGKHPYGYMGIAEIFVFAFFGLMATVGTTYTQTLSAPVAAWLTGSAMGLYSCALLMVNNIRDIPTDTVHGKKTLAVRLGDTVARRVYAAEVVVAALLTAAGMVTNRGLVAFVTVVLLMVSFYLASRVLSGISGKKLVKVLAHTGITTLIAGIAVFVCGAVG
ncbi:MAG: 1,4-dihydroxy-2-naphthoate polyprenyltransferase [Actinomycetaceae bacterium]|nr:1,4-dihydroxy-2-naphthoate polyprenyltransferase [Actinomycetaceae bacterium]